MSMNYLEFKRQLMVDPYTDDADFVAAKHADPKCGKAVADAMAFEHLLQQAMKVEVPPGLADQIILQQGLDNTPRRERRVWPLALAASFLAAVLTAGFITWHEQRQESLEAYVIDHWQQDGLVALQYASNQQHATSIDELQRILTVAGVSADAALAEKVTYAKNCPTPKGTGAHLVINTEQGPITVFYAPAIESSDTKRLSVDEVVTLLVSLQEGSAAVVGEDSDSLKEVGDLVRSGLRPLSAST